MGTTRRPLTIRPVLAIALAAITCACSAAPLPSGGSAATPPIGSASPAASGAPTPPVSAAPTSSPRSPADALEDVTSAEGALNAIWIGDGMVVAGGFAGPVFSTAILVFEDGAWSVAETPIGPGQVAGIARLGDRLIAVGNGLPDIRNGFIWDSIDGRVWQPVQTIENAALYDIVAGEGVVVAVGARLDAEMNATAAAWSSTDGTTWEPAEVAGADGPAMGAVTTTPDGFAAIGDRPLGEPRPFWTATAPTSWAAVENDLPDQRLPIDVVSWSGQYALVGASGRSGDQHPFVSLSADGRQWDETILSEEQEGYASAAIVANERLVVAGVDFDRLTLWALRDGTWEATTIEPSGAAISGLAWDPGLGLIGVGARDGRYAVWSLELQ